MPRPDPSEPRATRWRLAAVVAAALAISGCVLDVRLEADGSGAFTLGYRTDKNATLGAIAGRLSSPSVVVRSARIDSKGYGTFKARFSDVTTLSSAPTFKNVTVQRTPGAQPGTTDFSAKLVQPKPEPFPDWVIQHYGKDFTLTVTFPGPVLATNATSHDGATATWVVPLRDMSGNPETVFTATYRTAG